MGNVRAVVLYFLTLGLLVLATHLLLRLFPWFARTVLAGEGKRKPALDGLRGILALSVMIHHTLVDNFMASDRSLEGRAANYITLQLGAVPVGMFFMISAFLFGGRLLHNQGRLDIWSFFYGRFMRIVPLYLVVVGFVTFISFAVQGFRLVVPLATLIKEIGRHLSFDFLATYGIDGFAGAHDLLGPVWTLHYEWAFYFGIPIMALLYRRVPHAVVLYIPLLAIACFRYSHFYFFAAGIASAQLSALDGPWARRLWPVLGAVSLIALAIPFHHSDGLDASLLIPTMVAVLQGGRRVAFLGTAPFRYLGEMSFSIYLLHMPLIYVIRSLTGLPSYNLSPLSFVGTDVFLGICVIAVSTVTFLFVEKPLMHVRPRRRPLADLSVPDSYASANLHKPSQPR